MSTLGGTLGATLDGTLDEISTIRSDMNEPLFFLTMMK